MTHEEAVEIWNYSEIFDACPHSTEHFYDYNDCQANRPMSKQAEREVIAWLRAWIDALEVEA